MSDERFSPASGVTESRAVNNGHNENSRNPFPGGLSFFTARSSEQVGGLAVHAAWLVCSVSLSVVASWCGTRFSACHGLAEVEARLYTLEMNKESFIASSCFIDVSHDHGSWLFFRADGSEARRLEAEACSCGEVQATAEKAASVVATRALEEFLTPAVAGRCVVDISLGSHGDELQLRHLDGETTDVSLQPPMRDGLVHPKLDLQSRASTPGAEKAQLLPQVPVHVVTPPPLGSGLQLGYSAMTASAAPSMPRREDSAQIPKEWPPPIQLLGPPGPNGLAAASSVAFGAIDLQGVPTQVGGKSVSFGESIATEGQTISVMPASAHAPATPTPSPPLVQLTKPHAVPLASIEANSKDNAGSTLDDIPELTCDKSGRTEWVEVKAMVAQIMGTWSAGVFAMDLPVLRGLLDIAVQRLQPVHSPARECGMGRLCMSILTILLGDAGRSLLGAPALHSPLLTAVLDLPWSRVMRSGWPFFAFLAQLHLHTHGQDDIPSVRPEVAYFVALKGGLERGDVSALAGLGADFLERGGGRPSTDAHKDAAGAHAMPALCALASQLLDLDLAGAGGGSSAAASAPAAAASAAAAEYDEALAQVQGVFRQVVQSLDDLDATLASAWPLYSVLHMVSLQLMTSHGPPTSPSGHRVVDRTI